MKKIILASHNPGKLKELKRLLKDYEVISQDELHVPDVEETGLTFVENAIIKARNACKHTGLPAVADDSGLEVDALNGRPGIYSARFAIGERTTKNYCDRLLKEMENVPEEKRTARFQSVIVFMHHELDPSPIIGKGTWEGRIIHQAKGDHGFGYDPVFYVDELHSTVAELSPEIKNQHSHRAKAIHDLLQQLKLYAK